MMPLLTIAAALSGVFSLAGHVQGIMGAVLLARFRRQAHAPGDRMADDHAAPPAGNRPLPPLTIMKPLHGNEPLLEEALESFFTQDYPCYQIVFGLHDEADPALPVIRRLQARHPGRDVAVVINTAQHGPNRKVGNLINMYPACRHDVLLISDSDIHASPDYARQVVTSLQRDDVQLVTTLYAGRPAGPGLVRKLGAHSINVNFLPGVMMSRLMGREDCLGATMALHRQRLAEIGGLDVLVQHVADDATLGQLIRHNGGRIALAPTLCHTTVSETRLGELFSHELRWGRTVRSVEPVGYGLSALQLPLFWGGLCVLFAPFSLFSWSVLAGGLLCRGVVTQCISRLTNCALPGIFPFLMARDWLTALVMLGSARGSRVAWRGQTVHITRGKKLSKSL